MALFLFTKKVWPSGLWRLYAVLPWFSHCFVMFVSTILLIKQTRMFLPLENTRSKHVESR